MGHHSWQTAIWPLEVTGLQINCYWRYHKRLIEVIHVFGLKVHQIGVEMFHHLEVAVAHHGEVGVVGPGGQVQGLQEVRLHEGLQEVGGHVAGARGHGEIG